MTVLDDYDDDNDDDKDVCRVVDDACGLRQTELGRHLWTTTLRKEATCLWTTTPVDDDATEGNRE